jgi:hypothetical protein
MQITIDLPDNLTDKIQDKFPNLSQKILNKLGLFGIFYGKPGSKSLKALFCRYSIQNNGIILDNPCPIRVLL